MASALMCSGFNVGSGNSCMLRIKCIWDLGQSWKLPPPIVYGPKTA